MENKLKIWDNDHTELVQLLMDELPLAQDDITRRVITAAYKAGYEPYSDGITLMQELEFGGFSMKHPLGVGHDWMYFMGMKNPFLPEWITDEMDARKWCDDWFGDGLNKFGHWFRAPIWWFGLRMGGWRAWNIHRKAGHPDSAKRDKYGMIVLRKFGWHKDKKDKRDKLFRLTFQVPAILPSSVDLRAGCSPVEDQGVLGSCTAQVLAGALEYLIMKEGAPFIDLSRLFIYYNEREAEGNVEEDSGAQLRTGIKTLVEFGVCRESLWPYDSPFMRKPTEGCYLEAADHQIIAYQRIGSLAELKTSLAAGFPVPFGFMAYPEVLSEEVTRTGDIPMPGWWQRTFERPLSGHAILAVGYDDATGKVLFRNSWGKAWGKEGYGTIPYGMINDSRLSTDFWCIQDTESHLYEVPCVIEQVKA